MGWTDKYRKKRRFLWFPKTLNSETRWLTKTLWEEEYYQGWSGGDDWDGWVALRWLDREDRLRPFNSHWSNNNKGKVVK